MSDSIHLAVRSYPTDEHHAATPAHLLFVHVFCPGVKKEDIDVTLYLQGPLQKQKVGEDHSYQCYLITNQDPGTACSVRVTVSTRDGQEAHCHCLLTQPVKPTYGPIITPVCPTWTWPTTQGAAAQVTGSLPTYGSVSPPTATMSAWAQVNGTGNSTVATAIANPPAPYNWAFYFNPPLPAGTYLLNVMGITTGAPSVVSGWFTV
jgi:hypothetical protein